MVCEHCGKEMVKVGVLTEEEQQDFFYVNEKLNCAYKAQESDVLNKIKFEDGQVYEYFKATYEQLADAEYLGFKFYRDLKKRLNTEKDLYIEGTKCEVFVHPDEEK